MNHQEHGSINTCNKIYDSFKAVFFFSIKQRRWWVRLRKLKQSQSQIAIGCGHPTVQQHNNGKRVMKMSTL